MTEKQKTKDSQEKVLYPKQSILSNASRKLVHHHKGRQMVHQKPKIKE